MISQPEIELLADGRARLKTTYTVRAWPFTFWICEPFEYDGASIPELLRPFIGGPYDRRRLPAATVHDWLYASHDLPRWQSDLVFFYLLVLNGMPLWRAIADWWAVARFGASAWLSHGPEDNARATVLGMVEIFNNPQNRKG